MCFFVIVLYFVIFFIWVYIINLEEIRFYLGGIKIEFNFFLLVYFVLDISRFIDRFRIF